MALAPTLCNFYQKIQVHHLLHRDVREHCKLPHLRYYNIPQWPFLSKYYEAFLPSESMKLVPISCKGDFSYCLYELRKHYLNFESYLTFESTFNLEKKRVFACIGWIFFYFWQVTYSVIGICFCLRSTWIL